MIKHAHQNGVGGGRFGIIEKKIKEKSCFFIILKVVFNSGYGNNLQPIIESI